jgi:hypothetical protein
MKDFGVSEEPNHNSLCLCRKIEGLLGVVRLFFAYVSVIPNVMGYSGFVR